MTSHESARYVSTSCEGRQQRLSLMDGDLESTFVVFIPPGNHHISTLGLLKHPRQYKMHGSSY